MRTYDFLVDTYRTERLKTLSVWAQIPDDRMRDRLEPRARSPLEHMVHQCLSEDAWMHGMLGLPASTSLPEDETRTAFVAHYATASGIRLEALHAAPDRWFEQSVSFFDVLRSRAWILVRRFTHSAHHRGQLTACLRGWGIALYSTYGPTADTGGLAKNGAQVMYPFDSVEDLLKRHDTAGRRLPGPGSMPPTERP